MITLNLPVLNTDKYKSNKETYFKINGIVLSDITFSCYISQQLVSLLSDGSALVEFKVQDVAQGGGLDQLMEITKFVSKLDSVSNNLSLLIDSDGNIKEICNREILKQCWMHLKNEIQHSEIFNKLPVASKQLILKQGDSDYLEGKGILDTIKKSPIYYALIYPFYGKDQQTDDGKSWGSRHMSIILRTVDVPLINKLSISDIDEKTYHVKLDSRLSETFDLTILEKELKIHYPNFGQNVGLYNYAITHNYELEKGTNKIINCEILQQEKIDTVFEVVVNHKLNLL
ncbi:MAG: hypothetical protein EOP45_01195 [Sphingobacteriaceae bacterium]|nr:MAG: hypothetical protein EOP45_01195 [Sphingobacteriaceae bacterium]